jgi:hypothetical protein
MALGRSGRKIDRDMISTDFYYSIFLKCMSHASEYDLYQLSQIGMFMCGPGTSQHVPDEFWVGCLEPALLN